LNSGRSERNGDLFQSLTLDALLNGARRHKFGYESSDLFGRILRAVVPGARQAKHLAVRERLAEQRKGCSARSVRSALPQIASVGFFGSSALVAPSGVSKPRAPVAKQTSTDQ
jgi:hypothetical protein